MQICQNTRKTNPWVKAKFAISRCLSCIRTGDQYMEQAATCRHLICFLLTVAMTSELGLLSPGEPHPSKSDVKILVTDLKFFMQ